MSRRRRGDGRALRRLARLHGIQLSYVDDMGRRRTASEDALLDVLRAFGVPLTSRRDAPAALRKGVRSRWHWDIEPVAVAWDGGSTTVPFRLPRDEARGVARGRLGHGAGADTLRWDLTRLRSRRGPTLDGREYVEVALPLPGGRPTGYHPLQVRLRRRTLSSVVIAAPRRAYAPPTRSRRWGVFVPLYALHSERSWGIGDFSDLGALVEWVGRTGGTAVATLPLLATFLDRPYDPSPYRPVSRRFWNDVFLDLERLRVRDRPDRWTLRRSAEFSRDLASARAQRMVDYRAVATLKDRALRSLIPCAGALGRDGREPRDVSTFARFRAASARGEWGRERLKERGDPGPQGSDDRDADVARHAIGQRLAEAQLQALTAYARGEGVDVYLDLPLGVHPEGYDVWRDPDLFVRGATLGAPPDRVFASGQDWGLPPIHPERLRRTGYRHVVDVLRRHMRFAKILRIDHVMGLHRLFWIPRGRPPIAGVFVRYPHEEAYAILSVESHRHRCVVVGENLGTVPAYVNAAMHRHGILGMFVVQYELEGYRADALRKIPARAVASVNTHDMVPFAGYWRGDDIARRVGRGAITSRAAHDARIQRARVRKRVIAALRDAGRLRGRETVPAVYRALLAHLAASPAWLVLVNLEDLWGETEPQNVPGTGPETPNWRWRCRYGLEDLRRRNDVLELLRVVVEGRRRGAALETDP